MDGERFEVRRTIATDPTTIFRLLCDPHGHVSVDSSGMLMGATGDPVRAVGDTFVVHMDREAMNDRPMGRYDVRVTIETLSRTGRSHGQSPARPARRPATSTATGSNRPRAERS